MCHIGCMVLIFGACKEHRKLKGPTDMNSSPRTPTPGTLYCKPEALDPEPQTLNPKPLTLPPKL